MKKDDAKKNAKKVKKEEAVPEERMLTLRRLLEALVAMNVSFLKRHEESTGSSYPSLYNVAPKYGGPADFGVWQDIPHTARRGIGDACDLVCWRVAELRAQGYEDAEPVVKVTYMKGGGVLTTVQVRVGDTLEDPTAILGGA